ncbi:MAG: hypothetical protein H6977_10365 [Gammaproteobacteria bacterium]|nr:hypothetical protein [Gammaproteobacteria bacterium]
MVLDLSELELAVELVSAASGIDSEAYIRRSDLKVIVWIEDGESGPLPPNVSDESLFIAVPTKNELEIDRRLAFEFTESHLSDEYEVVQEFFKKKGAYGRFRDLLERNKKLELWYEYQAKAVQEALRSWCKMHNLKTAS